MIQLSQHHESVFAFSSQSSSDDPRVPESKWTVVRQRLPDILAMSSTYKPTSVRAQLMLLVALMNRQTKQLRRLSQEQVYPFASALPRTIVVKINGRRRYINVKRIPPEQMIHADIDGFAFSIPTRQLILAISRGDAHETAVKYCPPAIQEMLIDLSKTKVVQDGREYKRALLKMRMGQAFYIGLFMVLLLMILALIVSASHTLWNYSSLNSSILLRSRSETSNFSFQDDPFLTVVWKA